MKAFVFALTLISGVSSAMAYAVNYEMGDGYIPTQYVSWCDQDQNMVMSQAATGEVVVQDDCTAKKAVCTESMVYRHRSNIVRAFCEAK